MPEFRTSHADACALPVSVRAMECCAFFGVPYAARSGYYGAEVRRLSGTNGQHTVGCLNQDWSGPMVVWYPEGDWLRRAGQCPHEAGYIYRSERHGNHGA